MMIVELIDPLNEEAGVKERLPVSGHVQAYAEAESRGLAVRFIGSDAELRLVPLGLLMAIDDAHGRGGAPKSDSVVAVMAHVDKPFDQ